MDIKIVCESCLFLQTPHVTALGFIYFFVFNYLLIQGILYSSPISNQNGLEPAVEEERGPMEYSATCSSPLEPIQKGSLIDINKSCQEVKKSEGTWAIPEIIQIYDQLLCQSVSINDLLVAEFPYSEDMNSRIFPIDD